MLCYVRDSSLVPFSDARGTREELASLDPDQAVSQDLPFKARGPGSIFICLIRHIFPQRIAHLSRSEVYYTERIQQR